MDNGNDHKKAKGTKKSLIKRKSKFKNYEEYNKATKVDNKIKYLEKNGVNTDFSKNHYEKSTKNNKLISKTRQRFKSKSHNAFTEEINKIALSSNDDKRIQAIDSIEAYAYETNKDLIREIEEIKCNNIIKQYTQ